jgi:hypothetical protein
METANYQILRKIEKSPRAQYITTPKHILQNYISSMILGLRRAGAGKNAYNVMTRLCNVYNAVFGNKSANVLQLYYTIIQNTLKGNNSNALLTSVNDYNALNYFINYLRDIISFLYKGNYINGAVYNFFINVFLQNIITLVLVMNEANFSIGDLSYYINNDYENCILSGNNSYACDYYMEGYKLLERQDKVDIAIPMLMQRSKSANAYIMSSTAAAALRMGDPEDQYKICTDTAFANNSSDIECNQYLKFLLN